VPCVDAVQLRVTSPSPVATLTLPGADAVLYGVPLTSSLGRLGSVSAPPTARIRTVYSVPLVRPSTTAVRMPKSSVTPVSGAQFAPPSQVYS
jgi:hypothetical protein